MNLLSCSSLHRPLTHAALWQVLEPLVQHAVPCGNLALFAEITHETIPQVLHSTDRLYESMPDERRHDMILQSPLLAYLRANPGVQIVRRDDYGGTARQHHSTPHFKRYLEPLGWRYFTALCFYRRNNFFASLLLARNAAQGDFTTADLDWLGKLHPQLETALLRAGDAHEQTTRLAALEHWISGLAIPVVLLNWDLKIIHCSQAGRQALLGWVHGAKNARRFDKRANLHLSADLARAARLLKQRIFLDLQAYRPPRQVDAITLTHPRSPDRRASLRPLAGSSRNASVPLLQLEFASPTPAAAAPSRGYHLTATEHELTNCIAGGLSNKEIAARTGRTEGSVKTQLSRLYVKLGVTSRTQLLSRLH